MARGDGDSTSNDTPPVSPTRLGAEEPPTASASGTRPASDDASHAPPPALGSGHSTPSDRGASTPRSVRYRRSPGWASRWFRGRVLTRHRNGTEVSVIGSAAVTWMALDPKAASASPPDGPAERARSGLAGATVVDLADLIQHGWPDLAHVTVDAVEEALATLVSRALVEPVPSTVAG